MTCPCFWSERVSSGSSTAYSQLPEQRGVQAKTRLKLHSEEYPAPWMLFSLEATLSPCNTRPPLQEAKARWRRVPAFPASPPATQLDTAQVSRNIFKKADTLLRVPAPEPVWPPNKSSNPNLRCLPRKAVQVLQQPRLCCDIAVLCRNL